MKWIILISGLVLLSWFLISVIAECIRAFSDEMAKKQNKQIFDELKKQMDKKREEHHGKQ